MLNLFSKSSFTFCKLRFLGLRSPKTISFYTRFSVFWAGYFGVLGVGLDELDELDGVFIVIQYHLPKIPILPKLPKTFALSRKFCYLCKNNR